MSEMLSEFLKDRKFDYHFDDNVAYGKRQPISSNFNLEDKCKIRVYSSLLTGDDIRRMSIGLPKVVTLRNLLTEVFDQKTEDIAVSCVIAAAINIRTNYINSQRYRVTRWVLGNKFIPVIPSVTYIHWNANVQNINKNKPDTSSIGPSIASHLFPIESHKVVDVSKYTGDITDLTRVPNLNAFYLARKTADLEWFKLDPTDVLLKLLLSKGYPIMCAIVIYDSAVSIEAYQFGVIGMPPNSDSVTPKGSQPILLIGYNEEKQQFDFVNSLGSSWGAEGCGTIDYKYILDGKYAGDFYYVSYRDW